MSQWAGVCECEREWVCECVCAPAAPGRGGGPTALGGCHFWVSVLAHTFPR